MRTSTWLATLLIAATVPVTAHNGVVSYAVEVDDIVVDGDLSDWPADTDWHEITHVEFGDPVAGPRDLRAWHAVGLGDEGRVIYVAVRVEDDEWVDDPTDRYWASEDGIEVYFAPPHDSGPVQLEMRGEHYTPRNDETVALRHTDTGRIYEWRVPVAGLKGAAEAGIERLTRHDGPIGYDVAIADVDSGAGISWASWGPGSAKLVRAQNMGDLLAEGSAAPYGTLAVTVTWPDGSPARRLRLQMGKDGQIDWLRATDAAGRLRQQLPAGHYSLTAGRDTLAIEVRPEAASEGHLSAEVHSVTAELGKGTTTTVDLRVTDDPWLTIAELSATAFVSAIAEDTAGGIWVASYTGLRGSWEQLLTHYSKGRVTEYTLADGIIDNITDIHADAENRLWFSSHSQGLQSLRGDTLTRYAIRQDSWDVGVDGIAQDAAGRLWLSMDTGLSIFDGHSLQSFSQEDGVAGWSPLAASEDGMWVGSRQVLNMKADGTTTRLDTAGMADYRGAVDIDANGSDLWIAESDRLWHFDGTTERQVPLPEGWDRVETLEVDSKGRPWVGTWGDGMAVYDGYSWNRYTTADGLVNDQIVDLLVDRHDRVWGIGLVGGVSRLDSEYRDLLTTEDGLGHNLVVCAMEAADGSMWFGGYGGSISRRKDGQLLTWSVGEYSGNWGGVVWEIVEDGAGTVWARQEDILIRFDGQDWKAVDEPPGAVGDLHVYQGDLWLHARAHGNTTVYRHHRDGFERTHRFHQFASVDFATDAAGTLWMGGVTHDQGPVVENVIQRWNGSVWQAVGPVEGLAPSGGTGPDGPFGARLAQFLEVGGRILTSVFDHQSRRSEHHWFDGSTLQSFDLPLTVTDLSAWRDVHVDERGRHWIATWGDGLVVTDGQVRQSFRRVDGLAHDGTQGVAEDRNGDLWIPTERGVSRYRPTEEPPGVRITDVIADGSHGAVEQIGLPTTSGFVRIEFEGSSDFTPPNRMAFVYRLHESDDWQPVYEPFVELTDLPRGDYTFEVRAVDRDLNYSVEPARLSVSVHLPYERMSWAGGLALALALVAWQSTRVVRRDRTLSQQNRELTVEGGIERVRAEVASMSGMDDLQEVIHVSRTALNDIGLNIHGFTFIVIDADSGQAQMYDTGSGVTELDMNEGPQTSPVLDHWKRGEAYHRHDGRRWVVDVPSEFGTLAMSRAEQPFSDDEIGLLRRFAEVASTGYQRYLDFQHLEAQNEALGRARDAAEAANRAKSQFLANMSHEIRTPMNAILGYAQILKRADDLTADHRHAVETIHGSGDHLLNLINDVLDISKIEAGRMELTLGDFDLREMLSGLGVMFEMHCREKGLAWQLAGLPPGSLPVHGDEAKLRQVIINLLGNAVKFTDEGDVSLRLHRVEAPAGNGAASDRYRIEVTDTGPGMTAAEREAIFQPFQQGAAGHEAGGTGLGLAITQRQLELMGSRLQLESAPGQGSTFHFEIDLPAAEGELLPSDAHDAYAGVRHLAAGESVKVLLADDVRANRDILETMLADLGATVATATNGREALDQLQVDKPDIVFFDVRMPVMDGLEAVRHLRQLDGFEDVKAIAISASVLDHERQGFLEEGFDDFIDKPFRFERVCAALAEQLGVEFESAAEVGGVAAVPVVDGGVDYADARVPEDLRAQLLEAAELYSVTEIEQYCTQLEGLGEAEARLAAHLRTLSQQQDMDAIQATLQEVTTDA